jgi:hypothetical protein
MTATTPTPAWFNLDGLVSPETREAIAEASARVRAMLPELDELARDLNRVSERYLAEVYRADFPAESSDQFHGLVNMQSGFDTLADLTFLASYLIGEAVIPNCGAISPETAAEMRERYLSDAA